MLDSKCSFVERNNAFHINKKGDGAEKKGKEVKRGRILLFENMPSTKTNTSGSTLLKQSIKMQEPFNYYSQPFRVALANIFVLTMDQVTHCLGFYGPQLHRFTLTALINVGSWSKEEFLNQS